MKPLAESAPVIAQHIGMLMMTLAATFSMVDMSDHPRVRAMLNQPAFAYATAAPESQTALRREKEESAPHYISYGISQRTPGRTGRR